MEILERLSVGAVIVAELLVVIIPVFIGVYIAEKNDEKKAIQKIEAQRRARIEAQRRATLKAEKKTMFETLKNWEF